MLVLLSICCVFIAPFPRERRKRSRGGAFYSAISKSSGNFIFNSAALFCNTSLTDAGRFCSPPY